MLILIIFELPILFNGTWVLKKYIKELNLNLSCLHDHELFSRKLSFFSFKCYNIVKVVQLLHMEQACSWNVFNSRRMVHKGTWNILKFPKN